MAGLRRLRLLPERRSQRAPISEMLQRIPDRRMRAHAKAEAHVAALEGQSLAWDDIAVRWVRHREIHGVPVLECWVEGMGDANPFQFVNPPVIHDGVEDVGAAFRAIVSDAVNHARGR